MGIYSIKPTFQKFLKPVEKWLIEHRVHPTEINIAALVVSILGGFVLYFSFWHRWLLIFFPILAFVRTAMNALDGMVARATKAKHQAWGEVLNEFIDRVSDIAIFMGLVLNPAVIEILGWSTLLLVLLVSYVGILSKAAGGKRQYGGFMGKADRMLYVSVGALMVLFGASVFFFNYVLLFVLVGTLITLGQRFEAIKHALRR